VRIVESSVSVSGGDLYVKCCAPANSDAEPPVILFHDSIGCAALWRDFPSALARALQRRVITYDRLGYGNSSTRSDLLSARFVTEEAEQFFPRVKQHLGLRNYVLFGHSVGGCMAVVAAGLFPGECAAVITEAAQTYVEPKTLQAIRAAKKKFKAPSELAKLEKYHGSKSRWVVDAWTDTWLSPAFANWGLLNELPKVKCPLLAIHGDRDEYGSTAFPRALSTMTSGYAQEFIVPDCGHVPHRERESQVLHASATFLENQVVSAHAAGGQ
jgi:pimeloyl-ACP methyl ester carboxylesterase